MIDAKWLRNSFFYLIVLIFLVAIVVALLNGNKGSSGSNDLSALMNNVRQDYAQTHQPDTLIQDGQNLTLKRPNNLQDAHATLGGNDSLSYWLTYYHVPSRDVQVTVNPPSNLGTWLSLLGGFIPVLIIAGFLIFMMRQAQGSNNQALSFGKSRARMFTGNRPTVT